VTKPVPEIVVRAPVEPEPPLSADLLVRSIQLLVRQQAAGDAFLARMLPLLVAEGQRFAETAKGQHWKALLQESPMVEGGATLWRALGLESHLQGPLPTDVASDTLDALLRTLAQSQAETVVRVLDAMAAEMAAARG
jgi:hypothetical protein